MAAAGERGVVDLKEFCAITQQSLIGSANPEFRTDCPFFAVPTFFVSDMSSREPFDLLTCDGSV